MVKSPNRLIKDPPTKVRSLSFVVWIVPGVPTNLLVYSFIYPSLPSIINNLWIIHDCDRSNNTCIRSTLEGVWNGPFIVKFLFF